MTRPSRRMPQADGHYCDRCRRFARSSAAWARSVLKPISESESHPNHRWWVPRNCAPLRCRRVMADASPGDHVAGRHELTLAEWTRLAPLLPARETRGTYYADRRRVLNRMLYRHATGCAWRDRPPRYGPCSTVASRQRRWTREGLWGRILAALQGELAEAGRIDWERWCIDGSHVRAHLVAAGARENRPPRRAGRPRAGAQPRRVHDQAAPRH